MPKNKLWMSLREKYLISKYGITQKQYDKILSDQGGTCVFCPLTKEKNGRYLAVDHDHKENKKIRGVLCNYHNHRLVGRHRDSELLRKVADYLERDTGFRVPDKKPKKRKKRKTRGRSKKSV